MPLPNPLGTQPIPTTTPIAQTQTGIVTPRWLGWFRNLQSTVDSLRVAITGTLATVLQDTHANRLASFPQINYDPGTLFYETDRTVVYRVNAANTAWVYAAGEMSATFANVPTDLGADDAGFLLQITDYGHRVRWSGTAWDFAPGDQGNAYFQDFAVAPSTGWKLCDGTATTYLVMGVTIAATAFTTPNLSGTAAYRKSAAAYSGTITAATAPGLSGDTGSTAPAVSGDTGATAPTISGNVAGNTATISGATANESAHTHAVSGTTSGPDTTTLEGTGVAGAASSTHTHTLNVTSGAGSAHSHGVGTLAVNSHDHGVGTLAVGSHTHGAGTLTAVSHLHGKGTLAVDATGEPARMGAIVYFRR